MIKTAFKWGNGKHVTQVKREQQTVYGTQMRQKIDTARCKIYNEFFRLFDEHFEYQICVSSKNYEHL